MPKQKYFSKTILIKKGKKKNNQPEADIQQYMLCSNSYLLHDVWHFASSGNCYIHDTQY